MLVANLSIVSLLISAFSPLNNFLNCPIFFGVLASYFNESMSSYTDIFPL